jgi:hypothetical protein
MRRRYKVLIVVAIAALVILGAEYFSPIRIANAPCTVIIDKANRTGRCSGTFVQNTATPRPTAPARATPAAVPSASPRPGGGRAGQSTGCRFDLADRPLNVAFCDSFDAPAGTGNRSGDLNGLLWGTSRISENTNPGQGLLDAWSPTERLTCGKNQLVQPETDIAVCDGTAVEATTDNGNFTVLAMYPTQPFDIAGRTGTVVFDVNADSEGPHAAWPAFVYSDQPVPAPYANHPAEATYARNSFGFALAANPIPYCPADTSGVDQVFATSNYAFRELPFTKVDNCLTYKQGVLNHFEVRLSQSRVEIWGTNAGSTRLQELGYVADAGLTLTRGVIWIEDVHYFADKMNNQGTHTFAWDNVGFDGPTLPRDLHLDVLDSLGRNADGTLNLGWFAPDPSTDKPLRLTIPGARDLAQASGALLTLNFFATDTAAIRYRLNGRAWHTVAWPFPDAQTYQWRTLAVPIAPADLRAGTNVLDLEATKGGMAVANVDVILLGAQGVPAP